MVFLIYVLIGSLITTSIHAICWDGMVLGVLRAKADSFISPFWRKPLYDCIICMASFWGTIEFLFMELDWKLYFPFILAQCGLNVLISGIIYLAHERQEFSLPNEEPIEKIINPKKKKRKKK